MSAANNIYGSPAGADEIKEPKPPKAKKKGGGFAAIAIVLLILAAGLSNGIFVITEANEYKAVYQFGKIVSVTTQPGLTYKVPFLQSERSIPRSVQLYDLPISDVITMDKKTMVADSFVLWRVVNPTLFVQALSGNIANAEAIIENNVYNAMKSVISSLSQTDIISGRDKLSDAIMDNVRTSLDAYGIQLIAIETKRLDLPDDNKQAVYERMISERNNIAAAFRAEGDSEAAKIRNETDRAISIMLSKATADAEAAIAQGEAEYMRILAEAYGTEERAAFYSFVRSLDAARESLKGGDKTLILTNDSPIAQIFYGVQ